MRASILIAVACGRTNALMLSPLRAAPHTRGLAPTMEFGKGFGSFYSGWDDWVKEYPQADRDAYPTLFELPEDCYEVELEKPLGISFIEGDKGGVEVEYLVEGSNSDKSGVIKAGDVLLASTGCMGRDGTFERKMLPMRFQDFDTIMASIASNEPRFHKKRQNTVILQFARPTAPYENDGDPYEGGKRGITDYLESIKLPSNSPWYSR